MTLDGEGQIPGSSALAEAKPESISEFLSRNPTTLSPDERKKMVGILREQRKRWELAEAAGDHKRTARAPGEKPTAKSLITSKTIGELGL